MDVVKEFSDAGHSVKNINGRPEFSRMLEDIANGEDGVDFVLVFKLSRFGRNADDVLNVLHNACMIDGAKVNVMSAIDMMVESLKRIILDDSDEILILPIVLPIESMEGITE